MGSGHRQGVSGRLFWPCLDPRRGRPLPQVRLALVGGVTVSNTAD
jgi:hypothetical protein